MRLLRQFFGPTSPAPFRARLTLEALDGRLPPSTITGTDPDSDLTGSSALIIPVSAATTTSTTTTTTASPATASSSTQAGTAPQIIDFTWTTSGGGLVTFTGQVVDSAPAGLTVSFGGDPESLENKTATTDANGNFSLTLIMNTNGTDNGIATAQTTDGQGLQSNLAKTLVTL